MRRGEIVGFAVVGGAGALAAALGGLPCPLAALYHIPCPGCGMTRAVTLLAQGHLGPSLRMNAMAVPALGASLALAAVALGGDRWGASGPLRMRAAVVATIATYGAAVLLWALRWFGLFGGPVPV